MLESVGQEIEDNLVKVALVNPQVHDRERRIQGKVDMARHGHVAERLHDVLDKIDDVRFPEEELHLALVHLAHVHNLVHQAQNTQGIAVHQVVQVFPVRVLLGLTHLLQGRHQQCQRSADFVGDVGEHLQFQLFDFRSLLLFCMFSTPMKQRKQHPQQAGGYEHVRHKGPEGKVPGILHPDIYGIGRKRLRRAVKICLDMQRIPPAGQVGIGGRMNRERQDTPVLVIVVQLVGIAYAHGIGVFLHGKLQGEGIVFPRKENMAGPVHPFLVLDGEAAEIQRRHRMGLLVHHLGIKGR